MARDEDDDDGLPPLGENTDKFLDQAKKGQARNFLLVCKGNKVKYLAVKKKPVKKNELNEAKKAGYKGDGYFGVITGKGMELVFNLSSADGYTSEPVKDKILKDFLEEKADFKCKPTIAIVAQLPAVPFDEEDLKNPLVARFLALDVKISEVLDKNSDAEAELGKTTTEIRLLLQDADFDTAEPRIAAFEVRLQELLNGAQAISPNPPTANVPSPSQPNAPVPPTATVDNDALKQKLQEALNKLVPQLKQAVVTFPDKKVELLTPVAQIKKQMDSGDLQEAKKGIIAVGQLLKSVMAQSGNQEQAQTEDPLRGEYEQKLAKLKPLYDRALQDQLGDTSKFRTVMTYATEQASAGVYATAIKAIDRLTIAVQAATSTTSDAQAQSNDERKVAYEQKLASIQSNYDLALKNMYGDKSGFLVSMGLASDQAANGKFDDAIKILDILAQKLEQAIASGAKETDVIPENIIEDRKKFVSSRWQTMVNEAYAEIAKIVSPVEKQVPEEDPRELVSEIENYLDEFIDDLNIAIVGTSSATSTNMKPMELAKKAINDLRSKLGTDDVLAQLEKAKASLGVAVNVREKLFSGLDELEGRFSP